MSIRPDVHESVFFFPLVLEVVSYSVQVYAV